MDGGGGGGNGEGERGRELKRDGKALGVGKSVRGGLVGGEVGV